MQIMYAPRPTPPHIHFFYNAAQWWTKRHLVNVDINNGCSLLLGGVSSLTCAVHGAPSHVARCLPSHVTCTDGQWHGDTCRFTRDKHEHGTRALALQQWSDNATVEQHIGCVGFVLPTSLPIFITRIIQRYEMKRKKFCVLLKNIFCTNIMKSHVCTIIISGKREYLMVGG
jgi:hypothetical protein